VPIPLLEHYARAAWLGAPLDAEANAGIRSRGEDIGREGPQPLVTRHALEAFAIDGALYAIGGCTTALQDSPVVERLSLH